MDDEKGIAPPVWFKRAAIAEVDDYLEQGWVPDGLGPLPAHHGLYSVILCWPGPGDPPERPRRAGRRRIVKRL